MNLSRKFYSLPILLFLTIPNWSYQVFRSPIADGFDGYYYVMQIDSLLKHGFMHSEDFSLIYLPLILFSKVLEPLIAYKLTVIFIGILFSVSSYTFVNKHSDFKKATLTLLFTLLSPSVLFFLLQFPKNILGCSFLLLLVTFYKNRKFKLFALFFVLILFAHRLAFVIALCFFIIDIIINKVSKKLIIISCISIIVVIVIMLFFDIPGLLNIFDYIRIISEGIKPFSYWGQVSFFNMWSLWSNPSWIFDLVFIHLLILFSIVKIKQGSFLSLILLLLLIPIFEYSTGSLSYRLFLNGFLLLPIIAFSKINNKIIYKVTIFFLLISFTLLPFKRYDYNKFNPPIDLYISISKAVELQLQNKDVDVVIAHKGIKEQILINTKLEANNWRPDKITKTSYRVFTNIPDYLIIMYLSDIELTEIISLPGNYYLTSEELFIFLINKIQENESENTYRSINTWQNPLNVKPSFL